MRKASHNKAVGNQRQPTLIAMTQTIAIGVIVLLNGCQRSQSPQAAKSNQGKSEELSRIDAAAKEKAIVAKDALFARLSGRLTEVIKSDGPVAAISVCSQEAQAIATEVGNEHGVSIGRTSFKLRNKENIAPDWAHAFVKDRSVESRFINLPNGSTGAFLPIRLKANCLTCHGPPENIAADIRTKLSELYPTDQATGFREGDLRGWFWVEVPPTKVLDAKKQNAEKVQAAVKEDKVATTGQKKSGQETEEGSDHGFGRGMGRGGGFGRGMGRGPGGNPEMRADMTTLHAMFGDRSKIKRTVKLLPTGAEALTESDDKTIAALLKEHVPAMENRVHDNEPLPPMTFHPIFVGLIKHADDYTLTYKTTAKGIKVTYEADDPLVILLVQEHAKLVSRFIKNGMEEIHKPYVLPKVNNSKDDRNSDQ